MANRSQEDVAKTRAMLDQAVIEMFFESGFESITHGAIGKRVGMGRSSVQKYYYHGFSSAFEKGDVFRFMMSNLDFTDIETLKRSWNEALSKKKFRYVVELLFANAAKNGTPAHDLSRKATFRLINLVENKVGKGKETVRYLLGESILAMLEVDLVNIEDNFDLRDSGL